MESGWVGRKMKSMQRGHRALLCGVLLGPALLSCFPVHMALSSVLVRARLTQPEVGHRAAHSTDASGSATAITHYAGWAMTAYPDASQAQMDADVARQVGAGANLVWIGHDNPGDVGHPANRKSESGLSYAVYAAFRDTHDPLHADAVAMVNAEFRMLTAIRRAGAKAVLPVGYQIQMGGTPHSVCPDPPGCAHVTEVWPGSKNKDWNALHPGDLRRFANGQVINNGGWSASFYAASYRHDIVNYYHWINATFVEPYSSTIIMINLADEPSGGDYSAAADNVFRRTYGFGLGEAGNDTAKQRQVGRFESDYIANYATWSATQWLTINATISTTMSFDGGRSRYAYQEPQVEQLFRAPPPNFAVTFDAYPLDRDLHTAVSDADLTALAVFIRALGAYSARYHRPLYLWSAANDWGLNSASADPGTVADAVANGLSLAMLATSTGGDLRGIAAWSYYVKHQGLFYDDNTASRPPYSPDALFDGVSGSFPVLRAIMVGPRGQADTLLLAPDAAADIMIGWGHAAQAQVDFSQRTNPTAIHVDPYAWAQLAALARNNVASAVIGTLGGVPLSGIRCIIVLSQKPTDLTSADLSALRQFLATGGLVVATNAVSASLTPSGSVVTTSIAGTFNTTHLVARRLRAGPGILVAIDTPQPLATAFSDAAQSALPGLWQMVLGQQHINQQGFAISGGGMALLSTLAPGGSSILPPVPAGMAWTDGRLVVSSGATQHSLPDQPAGTQVADIVAQHQYELYNVHTTIGRAS